MVRAVLEIAAYAGFAVAFAGFATVRRRPRSRQLKGVWVLVLTASDSALATADLLRNPPFLVEAVALYAMAAVGLAWAGTRRLSRWPGTLR